MASKSKIEWTDEDLWNFMRGYNLHYCSLYDEGFGRLGCVGCPLASQKIRDAQFARWPRYERAWMRACKNLWQQHAGNQTWINKADEQMRFKSWEDHWVAWRGDMRKYCAVLKRESNNALCGDDDLTRYQQ